MDVGNSPETSTSGGRKLSCHINDLHGRVSQRFMVWQEPLATGDLSKGWWPGSGPSSGIQRWSVGRRTLGVEKRGAGGRVHMCGTRVCSWLSQPQEDAVKNLPWLEGEWATFGGGGHRTRKKNSVSSRPVCRTRWYTSSRQQAVRSPGSWWPQVQAQAREEMEFINVKGLYLGISVWPAGIIAHHTPHWVT